MTLAGRRPPLSKDTRLCISLAGRPSNFGTRFHNHLYEVLGLDFVYKAFTTSDIVAAIGGVRALGIRGCSVSMPFKQDVLGLVDQVEPSAVAIEAVNTIVDDNGRLTAANTDYVAVQQLIDENGLTPTQSVLIRGSGGMAGGPEQHDPAFGDAAIRAAHTEFDVVALPSETPLVAAARTAGVGVITGAQVIARQAAEQFERYTACGRARSRSPRPPKLERCRAPDRRGSGGDRGFVVDGLGGIH